MKKIYMVLLLGIMIIFLSHSVFAGEKIVSSKILTSEDALNTVKGITIRTPDGREFFKAKNIDPNSFQIIGIHQEGNKASIYCNFIGEGRRRLGVVNVVRFNSGEWFNPIKGDFVKN